MIQPGDKVPDLLGTDKDGKEIRLSDFPNERIALYFYPKDNTSGCTAEACSFRDHYDELAAAGCHPVGVSVDSAESHRKFAEKHSLQFPLIADTSHSLVEAMGVWGEKSMYGRKYMGTFRTTFIINSDGIVERVFQPKEIKTKTHAQQVLEAL